MRREVMRRALHTSAAAGRALPALSETSLPSKAPGLLDRLLGAKAVPVLPPMTEPLPGVVAPAYTAPTKAPATGVRKLANGAVIAAEDTPGATIAVGVYLESGSKYENALSAGAGRRRRRRRSCRSRRFGLRTRTRRAAALSLPYSFSPHARCRPAPQASRTSWSAWRSRGR